jgi:DMSO/TMAO reductase YedYZ molybdopterin-dependent catalytic subunit
MSRSRSSVPGVDAELLARDTAKLLPEPTRRAFLQAGASVGALAFLTGCDIIDGPSAENALRIVSRFNDRVQAWLFDPNRLAPIYPETAITRPFPFNAYYREEDAPDIDEEDYKLLIDGLVDDKRPWTLDRLYALPQETQITRLVCVEGWSAIGKWTGTPLREFLRRIGADMRAKFVHFTCAEGYSSSIDMATALHPQTQLTFKYDGDVLPPKYGFPTRVRIPTKLGFKKS